ncbi:hypothetical protein CK203_013178 [Vitis vinifera]|uniref:WD repeat-containing protein 11 n=1 Tax=Vitis vinifera TaxID=29760 RepID=A0A438JQ78_VITVI|nr:hypothetical protein CK203_013178 [Vitis vinifera]
MKFWKDICCGDLALRISFYSSFTIAISKDAWVVDMWDELGEGGIGAPLRSLALPFTVLEWTLPTAPRPVQNGPSRQASSSRDRTSVAPAEASSPKTASSTDSKAASTDEPQDDTSESFAFALVNGALGVFEVHGRRIRDFRPKWPSSSFVSSDGLITAMAYRVPHVVMGDRSGNIRWWDVTTGQSSSFNTHREGIRRIKFSPVVAGDRSRGRIAVLFYDNTFSIFDLDSQDPLANSLLQPQFPGTLVLELDWLPLRTDKNDPLVLCIAGADSSFRLVECLELEERQMMWVRWELERQLKLEQEFDGERWRRMRMEEKREEEEMEWKKRVMGLQIELEKQMLQILLSQRFPHLYGMAAHRNATVEEMWDQNVGQGGWDLRFMRDFNDWELDMVGTADDLAIGVKPHWFNTCSTTKDKRHHLIPGTASGAGDLRSYMIDSPPVGDSVVPEMLLKVLEPYRKEGSILDDERARLYAAVVKKGSAARFAFAAAIFGDSLEAIFWLQLRHAVNHLMNKLINKSPQKASVQASISELDDASILSRITSKGKSIPGARKRDALDCGQLKLMTFEQEELWETANERITWHEKLEGAEAIQNRVHE